MDGKKIDHTAAASEIRDILENYDIGELVTFTKNERGYVNTSYEIETIRRGKRKRYFLRRYKIGVNQEELEFEHVLISHLLDRNFSLAARVFETKEGSTYCRKYFDSSSNQPVYYAIFDFLPGEDKYTCVDPKCSLVEIKNSAGVLADFHNAVQDLIPKGQRLEPKILDLLPQIREKVINSVQFSKRTTFDQYLQANLSLILNSCKAAEQHFSDLHTSAWPQYVIHCDFHPGNLKFKSEQVVALFDFDWSKIDLRCFDVALAVYYFFTSWKGSEDGILRLDESRVFLDKYQSTMQNHFEGTPLLQSEFQDLPMMINLSNLYVLNWAVTDFYAKDVDPEEYLMWLRHCVNFTRWSDDSGYKQMQKELIF
jgi:homoserine kinase type II